MKVLDLKDLEKVIKLCRKTGVDHIIVDGIEINLGSEPVRYEPYKAQTVKPSEQRPSYNPGISYTPDETVKIPTDSLTEEQLLLWSTGDGEQQ